MPASPENQLDLKEKTSRSPIFGCLIFSIILLVLASSVGMVCWQICKMDRLVSDFANKEPVSLKIDTEQLNENSFKNLEIRFEKFAQELEKKSPVSFRLDIVDLNTLIAHSSFAQELRTTCRVREITPDFLKLEVSFPLNPPPFSQEKRWLVGTISGRPEARHGEVLLEVSKIEVPGKTVPQEFLNAFSPWRFLEKFSNSETQSPEQNRLSQLMPRITRIKLESGALLLFSDPKAVQNLAEMHDTKNGSAQILRKFGFIALGFLIFAAGIIFILRKSKR